MLQANISDPVEIEALMHGIGQRAVVAAREIAIADTATKNSALLSIASRIEDSAEQLLEANLADMAAARARSISGAMLDRLELTPDRIQAMADGLRQIAQLPDPVGALSAQHSQPSGLQIGKMRVPLGVIGIIYESRPNVTVDAAALCLKSGNAVILRGGSEAILSNQAIAGCVRDGLAEAGMARDIVQLVDTTDREAVGILLTMDQYVNVIIPRGGKSLVQRVSDGASVPVIKHLEGLCHVYIDDAADTDKAIRIAVNSKTYRYGICGALETLLVARAKAGEVLPEIVSQLQQKQVEIRGCDESRQIVSGLVEATEEDWLTEYLAPILSVRVVADIDEAVVHIQTYGSSHTDAIVTESLSAANYFTRIVDSSSVMVNASTCFADGYQYGLGAEIGISTDKLHVRGPVGLEGLTSEKYVVFGDGTTRA